MMFKIKKFINKDLIENLKLIIKIYLINNKINNIVLVNTHKL
jgi:hypothetical protein